MVNKFGWSYPPGCSGPPEPYEPSELTEAILGLLEDAGVPTLLNDAIIYIVEGWESRGGDPIDKKELAGIVKYAFNKTQQRE